MRKSVYDCPPIPHNGIIPGVGSKLRKDLLTCDRCWARDLVWIWPPVCQACKACRITRGKCSRVFPSCPRHWNLTEEDQLRWRVHGINPGTSSSIRRHSNSQGQWKHKSSQSSRQHGKHNSSRKWNLKIKEDDKDNEDSKEDNNTEDGYRGGNKRGRSRRQVSWTRSGQVVRYGYKPLSPSSSLSSADQRVDDLSALLEGKMLQMENAMKETAKSMKDMSSVSLNMSHQMVCSSSSQ